MAQPTPRLLRAGPLTVLLDAGALRAVTLEGEEVVRGVYAAVRDRNWGTLEPRFTRYEVQPEREQESFRVRFTAEHRQGPIDFVWDGEIDGAPDGTVTFSLDGLARSLFLRNRIGFCVLHPMALAGRAVEVETPEGTVTGVFPEAISPHQPFFDIVAIRHGLRVGPAGAGVEVHFEGDLFEMEDQRNWTDASYKTYCTPLAVPFPVEVAAGTRVRQRVTLRPLGPLPTPSGVPGTRSVSGTATDARVTLAHAAAGTLPPIGFGLTNRERPLTPAELERLRSLRPAHLQVTLHLTAPDWPAVLERAAAASAALGAPLELEVVAGDAGEGLPDLAAALSRAAVARAFVYPTTGVVSTSPVLAAARQALAGAGVPAVGGGTRADFVNLNRAAAEPPGSASALPLHLMDVVVFAVNPQVHAFDDRSLVETLACQEVVLANARRLAGRRPVSAGPVTFKQRLNPAATDPTAGAGSEDPRADPRQALPFGAAWTLGSLRHLAAGGAATVTYFETTGPLGVMRDGGDPLPVTALFAAVAPFAGAAVLDTRTDDPLAVEALALRAGGRVRLLVANLTATPRRVAVDAPGFAFGPVRTLDGEDLGAWTGTLHLPPHATAVTDGTPGD